MLLIQCVKAFEAVSTLLEQEMSYEQAHALVMAKNRLREHMEFYAEQEIELMESYGVRDETGRVRIENGSFGLTDSEAYHRRRMELEQVEVELEPVKMAPPQRIRGSCLEALSGVVLFETD